MDDREWLREHMAQHLPRPNLGAVLIGRLRKVMDVVMLGEDGGTPSQFACVTKKEEDNR